MESPGYLVKRVQQSLRTAMDASLRTLAVTTPQYAVLTFLDESPGLSGAQLSRKAFVTPQTMNRIVVNLEAAGLVERGPHPESGRILAIRLSRKGRGRLAECHRRVQAVERKMLAGMTPAEQRQLAGLLRRCADSLRARSRNLAIPGKRGRDDRT